MDEPCALLRSLSRNHAQTGVKAVRAMTHRTESATNPLWLYFSFMKCVLQCSYISELLFCEKSTIVVNLFSICVANTLSIFNMLSFISRKTVRFLSACHFRYADFESFLHLTYTPSAKAVPFEINTYSGARWNHIRNPQRETASSP